MSDPLSPISRITADRRAGRRVTDPMIAPDEDPAPAAGSKLPVPVAPLPAEPPQAAAFEAQILGQEGQKRGLKGGKPVLDHARSAYLGAEWSGKADRRPPRGVIAKTEI